MRKPLPIDEYATLVRIGLMSVHLDKVKIIIIIIIIIINQAG
jgi:hypothetical protein